MKYMQLERRNQVYVLTLTNGANANALNSDVLAEYFTVFDEIEANQEDASLLIQSNDDKTFCNGLDLPWLLQQSPQTIEQFIKSVEDFFVRMSVLNLPVIAAINGNCYAGGAVIAAACDFRVMRSDRGRFCFSEVNLKMPFTPPMIAVIQALPNAHALWELSLTGVAFGGEDCLKRQIVDQICSIEDLPVKTFKLAEALALKDRQTYSKIKRNLRQELFALAEIRHLYGDTVV